LLVAQAYFPAMATERFACERISFEEDASMGIPPINFKLLAKRLLQIAADFRDLFRFDRNDSWRNPRAQQFVIARATVRTVAQPRHQAFHPVPSRRP
jgi:hypothetical protein